MSQLAETVYRLSDMAKFRSMGDSAVILMIDSGQLFSCNETADAFLKHVNGVRTTGEIAKLVALEFDVDPDILMKDLDELIRQLVEENVLIAEGGQG